MLNDILKKRFSQESIQSYQDGEFIFQEGEQTQEMYIVQTGKVEILKKNGDSEFILASLGRGEFFGEMALLNSEERSASAKSVGETNLLTIAPGGFLLKIRRDPTFAFEMMQIMSVRIRTGNNKLLEMIAEHEHTDSKELIDNIEEVSKSLFFGKKDDY